MDIHDKVKRGVGPEAKIQDALCDFLLRRGWHVMQTHGNLYQQGFPDVYALHHIHGARWIEVKNPVKYSFTPAQRKCFPLISGAGHGIWILVAATEYEYLKLFKPENWAGYMYILQAGKR